MSVKRAIDNKNAAVTWWVDDVQFDEKGRTKQKRWAPTRSGRRNRFQVCVFDELIQNRDRNQGNLLWTKDWTLWLIDHTRAFRLGQILLKPEQPDALRSRAARGIAHAHPRGDGTGGG